MYVTRFQKERWTERSEDYPTIDSRFLKDRKFSKTSLLHPLPRVGELDIALDSDPRAAYFRQAAYGVPIRMALISLILGLGGERLKKYASGFKADDHLTYDRATDTGIRCPNKNCIVRDASEGRSARNRFHLIDSHRLRCFYCETDIVDFVVASRRTKHYEADVSRLRTSLMKQERDVVVFAHAADAETAGYSLPKRRRKAANA